MSVLLSAYAKTKGKIQNYAKWSVLEVREVVTATDTFKWPLKRRLIWQILVLYCIWPCDLLLPPVPHRHIASQFKGSPRGKTNVITCCQHSSQFHPQSISHCKSYDRSTFWPKTNRRHSFLKSMCLTKFLSHQLSVWAVSEICTEWQHGVMCKLHCVHEYVLIVFKHLHSLPAQTGPWVNSGCRLHANKFSSTAVWTLEK